MCWLRVVVIADWVIGVMVGSVIITWLLQLFAVTLLKFAAAFDLTDAERRFAQSSVHLVVACVVAFAYGAYRVTEFHPILNKPYGRWLATTPWKFPAPLPFGPIHLVWQDAVVLLILLSLGLLPPWWNLPVAFGIPLAFLAGYCLALGTALYKLESYRAVGLYAVLAGLALLAASYPPMLGLVAIALLAVSYLAIGALREFPYTEVRRKELGLACSELLPAREVYWTIAPLADDSHLELLNPLRTSIISFIAGWLTFGAATLPIEDSTLEGLWLMYAGVCLIAIGGRYFCFISHRYPPISIAGRIATGKYVIPGYDRMFIAPLVATVAAFLLPALLLYLGVWPPLAIAVSTTITVWLALALPPSFKEWYYTGHFQMVRPTMIEPKQPRARAGR